MFKIFKKFRNDVSDISFKEMDNIKRIELLIEEYKHINKQIQNGNNNA